MIAPGLLVAAAVVAVSGPAGPATIGGTPEAVEEQKGLAMLADDELDQQRGGFVWAGMEISLGAEIRSYVDGKLVLQTNVTWGANSASVQRVVFANAADAGAIDTGNAVLAATGFQLRTGDGITVLASGGRTAFIHTVGDSLQSIVLNTADGTNLRQEMNVTLNIANFALLRRAVTASRIGLSISGLAR